jgi:DNA topoisomerase-1
MQVAQQLFEGIEISGKKRVGFITYMRTDSLRVASHAIKEAKEYISKEIGKEYLPPKPRKYGKDEGAHEAIRPTSVKRTPESVKQNLTPKQFKLYSLIWRRFVASQMANAVYEYKKIDIKGGKYNLTKETENLKFDGFTKVYYTEHKKEEDIPELPKGTKLTLLDIIKEQKFTQPKPRYTEGKMVKELESKGIGRPSTYAPIISRIIEKEYVKKVKGRLVPTELGEGVNKILVSRFPDIFNVDFTRKMEEDLDKIETAKIDRVSVLKSFYEPFRQSMLKFFKEKKVIRKELTEVTEERCELCGKPMLIKWGRHGKFLACSGFPECKNAKPLETDRTQEACPKCNATLVKRKGKYGEFLACPNYPNCKFTKPISVGISCPECGNELVQRKTKKGRTFYGCTNYPKCEFAIWYKPVNKKCSSCGYPIMVERRGKLGCLKCKNIED